MNFTPIVIARFLDALTVGENEVIGWQAGPYIVDAGPTSRPRLALRAERTGTRAAFVNELPALKRLNHAGWSVFLRAPKRLIYADDITCEALAEMERDGIEPRAVTRTSAKSHQVWLLLPPDIDACQLYRALVARYGADPGATPSESGAARLGRCPEFRNTKPTRGEWVKLVSSTKKSLNEGGIRVLRDLAAAHAEDDGEASTANTAARAWRAGQSPPRRSAPDALAQAPSGIDRSRADCSWAMSQLRRGAPALEVEASLAASAAGRGKPDPNGYARRTVNAARRFLS